MKTKAYKKLEKGNGKYETTWFEFVASDAKSTGVV